MRLGKVYRQSGQSAEAIAIYEKVLELNPNQSAAQNFLSQLLEEQDN